MQHPVPYAEKSILMVLSNAALSRLRGDYAEAFDTLNLKEAKVLLEELAS
jgi:hypothetical protein